MFNAAVALNYPVQEFTRHADTVMICLSKGLCAPIGSVLAGPKEFIHRARRVRKMLGGGMRQVGILAAAGIVALEQMVNRLADDHANAETLSSGLRQLPGLKVPGMEIAPGATLTNMVFFELAAGFPLEPHTLVEQLDRKYHIKIEQMAGRQFRLVTHYWVSSDDVEQTLAAFRNIFNH